MEFRWFVAVLMTAFIFLGMGCSKGGFEALDFASSGPAMGEPVYMTTATDVTDPMQIKIKSKFKYRDLTFAVGGSNNGLGAVNDTGISIPFAEFRVFDSTGKQIQQGETDTSGVATFNIPKMAGTYSFKVYSRAYNRYLKVSVLEDTYSNQPYSVTKTFTVTSTDINAGSLDLTATPLFAEADETIAPKLEGGAFNIMFDILLANEYIRRQIQKNGDLQDGTPSDNPNKWWVADKVTVYWKMGFNPRSYFSNDGTMISFYALGTNKLYILGGKNGDVKTSDTDHFDDSVILHEYGHFLEDNYGSSASPGGSHNGNFIIDPRLAWSEGWANYFQAAVLTGAYNFGANQSEDLIPAPARYHYYVDTVGYGASGGIGIAFDLGANGRSTSYDNVAADPQDGTGTFREVSVSRTLYKSTRSTSSQYVAGKYGGGISFQNIWTTFSGENTTGNNRSNPVSSSLRNSSYYPIPNAGLFNYLLKANVGSPDAKWGLILSEEKQKATTEDYAFYVDTTNSAACSFGFNYAAVENTFGGIPRSNQQTNNDFYLYYHTAGSNETLRLDYTQGGTDTLDLDLIIYQKDYIYVEDYYVAAGVSSPTLVKQSRRVASLDGGSESVSLGSLPTGWYVINVKINAYNKTTAALDDGKATYTLKKDGVTLCGKER